jgi:hypothetical protein
VGNGRVDIEWKVAFSIVIESSAIQFSPPIEKGHFPFFVSEDKSKRELSIEPGGFSGVGRGD